MDLKEFTRQTLVQIVEGAHEANQHFAAQEGRVHIDEPTPYTGKGKVPVMIDVNFDVAVTATETEGANGGGGLKVAGLVNIGGGAESKTENQTVSRVKYTLQLELSKKQN